MPLVRLRHASLVRALRCTFIVSSMRHLIKSRTQQEYVAFMRNNAFQQVIARETAKQQKRNGVLVSSVGSSDLTEDSSSAESWGTLRRRSRTSSGLHYGSDGLPLACMFDSEDNNSHDPYKHVRIFRRDMVENGAAVRNLSLSVDLPLKKFTDAFCDYEGRRCKLCNETFIQWHLHQQSIPHQGREALLLELVRANCGMPEDIVQMWWHRLSGSSAFERIPQLSHDDAHKRKRRLQYLLRFLKDRKILVDTFNVESGQNSSASRTWEFERLEFIGDNVVKYLLNDRLSCLFPVSEGGIRGKLGYVQFVMDGNDGLARCYDYLELQHLTKSDRVVSKFKSDVIETLFAELQVYLWSTEEDLGIERVVLPFTPDMISIRAVVAHVMEELAHVMMMYTVEYVLGGLRRIVREQQLQFVRASPLVTGDTGDGAAGALAEATRNAVQSAYISSATPSSARLSSAKVPHKHGAALYQASGNYDNFKQVEPLGGLLPRAFSFGRIATTPSYLPLLQEDQQLTRSIGEQWGSRLSQEMDNFFTTTRKGAVPFHGGSEVADSSNKMLTSLRSQPTKKPVVPELTIPELKDEDLITEPI